MTLSSPHEESAFLGTRGHCQTEETRDNPKAYARKASALENGTPSYFGEPAKPFTCRFSNGG